MRPEKETEEVIMSAIKLMLLTIVLFGLPALAQDTSSSGILIFPSVTFHQESGVVGGSSGRVISDTRLGYLSSSGLYFGMIFSTTTSSGSHALSQNAFGNSVGFFIGKWSLIGSYYLIGSTKEDGGPGQRLQRDGGTGYQFDLTYAVPAFSHFSVGPVLSYKSMHYRTVTQDSVVQSQSSTQGFFYPYIGIVALW